MTPRTLARAGALVLLAVAVAFLVVVVVAVARQRDGATGDGESSGASAPRDAGGLTSGAPRFDTVQAIADVLAAGGLGCDQLTITDDSLLAAREYGMCARQLGDIELRLYDGPPPAPAFEGYARSVLCPAGLDAFRYTRGANWAAVVVVDVPEGGRATQDPEAVVSLGAVTGGEVVTVPCLQES